MNYAPQSQAMPGQVRPDAISLLGKSAGWLRFLSIFSFLLGAIMVLGAVAFGPVIRELVPLFASLGFAISFLMSGFAVVYVVSGIRMWSYASSIRRLQAGRMLQDFESVMERQASLWITMAALIGVTILIGIGFVVYVMASVSTITESAA